LPGDVVGPAGATDDNIATFDGATGKLIQDGGEKITDLLDLGGTRAMSGDLDMGTNAVTNVGNVDGRDVSADGSTLDTHVGSSANPHTVTLTQALTGGSTTSGVDLEVTAGDSFILGENAATPWTPAAAKGAIWVKNDTPNTLYFTDDAGTDFQLGAGGASSIEKAFVASSHTGNNTAKSYLPFRGLTEHTSITTEGLSWIAPHDGEVKTVMVWPWSDCGSTVVGFHKNGNTTATETDTQSAGSQTATTFSFSSSSFSKGDRIHISFDPTNASGVTHVTLSLELDTST